MRGIFFSLPLVAWLFGHWTLIAMTFIYLISLYVWEDESLNADMVSRAVYLRKSICKQACTF